MKRAHLLLLLLALAVAGAGQTVDLAAGLGGVASGNGVGGGDWPSLSATIMPFRFVGANADAHLGAGMILLLSPRWFLRPSYDLYFGRQLDDASRFDLEIGISFGRSR